MDELTKKLNSFFKQVHFSKEDCDFLISKYQSLIEEYSHYLEYRKETHVFKPEDINSAIAVIVSKMGDDYNNIFNKD